MVKMTVATIIKKFKPEIAAKDGVEAIRISGKKPNTKEIDFIKANKTEIIAELKVIEAEKEIQREVQRREYLERMEKKKEEYLAITELHRCWSATRMSGITRNGTSLT